MILYYNINRSSAVKLRYVEGDYCFSLQDEEWFAISTLQNKLCTKFCINSQLNEMGAMHTLAGKINLFLSFAKS